MMTTESQTTVV